MIDTRYIPSEVLYVTNTLEDAEFEAYLVGGCVRDLILGATPKDWDITTNASPEDIIKLFGEEYTYYENKFGTVGIKITKKLVTQETEHTDFVDIDGIIEVTPYRIESNYTDYRRPDNVSFTNDIMDDLKRRDFTVNAMAFRPKVGSFIDLYGGVDDIKNKIIKSVGDPDDRFKEDALRMMRAIRFSAQLGFMIESDTMNSIAKNSGLLEKISIERIVDEFNKMIMSKYPAQALGMAEQFGLLKYIVPELIDGIGCQQGKKSHKYDVFTHLLMSLQHAADKELTLEERLSALFHDIGKPRSRRKKGDGYTFYGHEVIGEKMVRDIMVRLKYPSDMVNRVSNFVRWHMFFSDPDVVTLSAVRRMIRNVGEDNIQKLLNIRMCDRIGSGRPKEQPFRFRKYAAMVEEALHDPIAVNMLKINGNDLMDRFHEKPGPRIGWILHTLLEDVLDNPENNNKDYLYRKTKDLVKLPDGILKKSGLNGIKKQKEAEDAEINMLHRKHNVC